MQKVWKVAPGRSAAFWDGEYHSCLKYKCITINWLNDLNLAGLSKEKIKQAFLNIGDEQSANGSAPKMLYQFTHEISEGDTIIANRGLSEIVGIGRATSGYLSPDDPRNPVAADQDFHRHAILVEWLVTDAIDLGERLFNQPTVQQLNSEQCEAIAEAYRYVYPKLANVVDELMGVQNAQRIFSADFFDEDSFEVKDGDSRQFAERLVAIRQGQPQFRQALMERYGQQCQVTGCSVERVLEAAHIMPYRGEHNNNIENGLVLRADIHTLFDLNLLGIHPDTLQIELHPDARSGYAEFEGSKLRCPNGQRPSREDLKNRYEEFEKERKK